MGNFYESGFPLGGHKVTKMQRREFKARSVFNALLLIFKVHFNIYFQYVLNVYLLRKLWFSILLGRKVRQMSSSLRLQLIPSGTLNTESS